MLIYRADKYKNDIEQYELKIAHARVAAILSVICVAGSLDLNPSYRKYKQTNNIITAIPKI